MTTDQNKHYSIADKPPLNARIIWYFDCRNCYASCIGMISDPPHVSQNYCSSVCAAAAKAEPEADSSRRLTTAAEAEKSA